MIGDVIGGSSSRAPSKARNLGAAMRPHTVVLVFISIWLMNRFTDDGDEGVATI